jgi:hypothetical protein
MMMASGIIEVSTHFSMEGLGGQIKCSRVSIPAGKPQEGNLAEKVKPQTQRYSGDPGRLNKPSLWQLRDASWAANGTAVWMGLLMPRELQMLHMLLQELMFAVLSFSLALEQIFLAFILFSFGMGM